MYAIKQVRKNPLKPRSFDITFADRYSICVINADKFISESKPDKIANYFYNDTYYIDQNACTSPHLINWVGTNISIKNSKNIFWECVSSLVTDNYELQPVSAINKISTFYEHAIRSNGLKLENNKDNLIYRAKLKSLEKDITTFRCDSGYFTEYDSKSLTDLSKIINNKYQTLSYYGFEKDDFYKFINDLKPCGIDRIVPIGRTMDFSLTWDGYNLIDTLSRNIEVL